MREAAPHRSLPPSPLRLRSAPPRRSLHRRGHSCPTRIQDRFPASGAPLMSWLVYAALTLSHVMLLIMLAAFILHVRVLTDVSEKLFAHFGPQADPEPR